MTEIRSGETLTADVRVSVTAVLEDEYCAVATVLRGGPERPRRAQAEATGPTPAVAALRAVAALLRGEHL